MDLDLVAVKGTHGGVFVQPGHFDSLLWLPERLSPHSFRVAAITDLLTQGVPLEDVQHLAGHAEPRTTGLYDRRQKRVTRNIVERISL